MSEERKEALRVVDWCISGQPVSYLGAVAAMEARVEAIARGEASELVWLLEHPPLYTAGTSTNWDDLRSPNTFPVFETGRGGQFTYHGPGQRVVYVMLNVGQRFSGVRGFVKALEAWTIASLDRLGVDGTIREGRVGVWVARPQLGPGREDKIAAIGVRLRRWISFHGLSINVSPDLSHFDGIVPCGISDQGVTSLSDLGSVHGMIDVDAALRASFEDLIAPTRRAEPPELHALADRAVSD